MATAAEELLAIKKLMRAFPGSKILPALKAAGDLGPCRSCGHSTLLIDSQGQRWHMRCLLRSYGLDPSIFGMRGLL